MDGVDPRLRSFYAEGYREDDRLRVSPHGVLERVRTQELLGRYLPPQPAAVLDVGGGTGVHAAWLAERGYAVVLVDLVEEHVAHASALRDVSAIVGDARALPRPDDGEDAVLVLGPLYHLLERDARLLALREARRVARPGAPVFAAAISRYAALMDIGADGRLTEELEPFVRRLHRTGEFDTDRLGFTHCHFHTPDELGDESRAHRRTRPRPDLRQRSPARSRPRVDRDGSNPYRSAMRVARSPSHVSFAGADHHLIDRRRTEMRAALMSQHIPTHSEDMTRSAYVELGDIGARRRR